jgi:hypothetical protein
VNVPASLLEVVPLFAEVLSGYLTDQEILDTAGLFDVSLESEEYLFHGQNWLAVSKELLEKMGTGNGYVLVQTLLEQLDLRIATKIAATQWEARYAHELKQAALGKVKKAVESNSISCEIVVPAGSPFSAKSKVRELLATATTDVLIVDPYVGVGTLDCLLEVTTAVRLLTNKDKVEKGFHVKLHEFQSEGRKVELRYGTTLHDRHLAFNDRCFLIGGSLKDAGKKEFHCLEVIDEKHVVIDSIEQKWNAAISSLDANR